MPTARLIVRAEIDGRPLAGFPLVRTLEIAEVGNLFAYTMAHVADTFRSLPAEEQAEPAVVAIAPDRQVTARFNAQSEAGVPVAHRGLCLLFNTLLTNKRRDLNATVVVAEGVDLARLSGILAGQT